MKNIVIEKNKPNLEYLVRAILATYKPSHKPEKENKFDIKSAS